MAKPIKQTPILIEKDAVNFFQQPKSTAFNVVKNASTATATTLAQGKPVQFSGGSGGD